MKNKSLIAFMALASLALAILACGGGTAPASAPATSAPPAAPAATGSVPTAQVPQSGTLDIVNSFGYKDSSGYYHVVGLIRNGTTQALGNIELNLELKDTAGKTLLRDNNGQPVPNVQFGPMLDTLAPGESSPFDYYVNTASVGEPAPNGFKVTVAAQQASQVTRANVAVQNVQMVADTSGSLYITGEIINQDNKPAEIASYAAAALDGSNNVVADSGTGSLTRLLAPAGDSSGNDRTAFSIQIDSPGDVAKSPAVFLDAVQPDNYIPSNVAVQISNTYFDDNKEYHVVGTMTNNDKALLTIRLVAGLYAKDGTPLDADTLDSALDLAPGQSLPFDLNSFSVVGGLPDQAAKLDHYTVQVDPYWTFASNNQTVPLQTSDDKKTDNGSGQWDVSGTVTNTSGKQLSSVTVVVGMYDAQNKLIATESTDVSSQSNIFAANETDPYDLTLNVDPSIDASGFTIKTFAQGIEK